MTGSTLIIELHTWRGVGIAGGPLASTLMLGFASVTWIPFLLTEWLKTRVGAMRNALKGSRFPEMDAFGEKE